MIQNFRLYDKIIGEKLSQKYNARVCKIKFNKQLNNKKEQWHKALLFSLKPNLQTNLVTTLYYFKFSNQTIGILIYIKILKKT